MAWYSTANRVRAVLIVGAALIGWQVFALHIYPWWEERDRVQQRAQWLQDEKILRTIDVTQPYRLRWAARDEMPGLQLTVPVADFGAWRRVKHAEVKETADGPQALFLELPIPGVDELAVGALQDRCTPESDARANAQPPAGCPIELGSLSLHRSLGRATSSAFRSLEETPVKSAAKQKEPRSDERYIPLPFWVHEETMASKKSGDAPVTVWRFAGWECENHTAPPDDNARVPGDTKSAAELQCFSFPHWLAKYFPSRFNLRRVNALADCVPPAGPSCAVVFRYQGRPVEVRTSKDARLALLAAVRRLDRLARDTAHPPGADEQLARAERVYANCRLAFELSLRQAANQQCGLAVQLAGVALADRPAPAARIIFGAMIEFGYSAGQWNRWYAEEALAALALAGQAESVEAVQAHLVRIQSRDTPEDALQESYAALLAIGPRAAANPRLMVAVEQQLLVHAAGRPAEGTRLLDFLRATLEHAERGSGADSDAAFHARFRYCLIRPWEGVEAQIVDECANALLATWSRRDGTIPPYSQSMPPKGLVIGIARMLRACAAVSTACTRDKIAPQVGELRRLVLHIPGASADSEIQSELGRLPEPVGSNAPGTS